MASTCLLMASAMAGCIRGATPGTGRTGAGGGGGGGCMQYPGGTLGAKNLAAGKLGVGEGCG